MEEQMSKAGFAHKFASLALRPTTLAFILTIVTVAAVQGQTLTTLYSFTGGSDGLFPLAGLLRDSATGNLYGTTEAGGPANAGTVFQLSPNGDGSWRVTVLYEF